MEQTDRQLIEEKFKAVYQTLQAKKDLDEQRHTDLDTNIKGMQEFLQRIYQEQRKTNGHIRDLERETAMARIMQRKPILLILLMFFTSVLVQVLDESRLLTLIIKVCGL
jgi:hypothetical protein